MIVLFTGRILNSLALGDDIARGLGQRVGLARGVTALGIVLLCGSATALAGPIGFVGLVIPHAVRFLTGPDYRWILPVLPGPGPGAAARRRRDRPRGPAPRRSPGRHHDGAGGRARLRLAGPPREGGRAVTSSHRPPNAPPRWHLTAIDPRKHWR